MSVTAERATAVKALAMKLYSNRKIAHELHMSRGNVARILQDFVRPNCPCGRPGDHLGWCAARVEASEPRQLFMTNINHCRTLRRTLRTSGNGGIGVETGVIKAPPKPKSDSESESETKIEEKQEAPAKQSAPFRMFSYVPPSNRLRVPYGSAAIRP